MPVNRIAVSQFAAVVLTVIDDPSALMVPVGVLADKAVEVPLLVVLDDPAVEAPPDAAEPEPAPVAAAEAVVAADSFGFAYCLEM